MKPGGFDGSKLDTSDYYKVAFNLGLGVSNRPIPQTEKLFGLAFHVYHWQAFQTASSTPPIRTAAKDLSP